MSHPRGLSYLIIGGGIFGITGAIELRRRGHRVTVIDSDTVPTSRASSTDVSKVIRMDYGADEFYCRLMERAMDGWRAYNRAWQAPLFHETGFAILSSAPLAPGTFAGDSFALLSARGHTLSRLDADDIADRYTDWRAGMYIDGYFNPRAGWAESGQVVAALAARASDLGVEMCLGTPVRRLLTDDARVCAIELATGAMMSADAVIVAAGSWTPALVPELTDMLPAIAQPVIHLRPPDSQRFTDARFPTWAADIEKTGFYGFPATAEGVLKIANHGPGIAVERGAEPEWPAGADGKFRDFLRASLPGLAEAPIVHRRLCRYSDSRDGNFVIAAHPDRPGLVVAAGGSGHGFKFAPVLGALIADAVEGRDNDWSDRFSWRTSATERYEAARHWD